MNILVAASGTGGHLFPARYIIEALLRQNVSVAFVGSGRPLEEEIIAPTGVPSFELAAAGIKNRGLRGILEFFAGLPKGISQTYRIFREFQPDAVIGVGGYVTFLPITFAVLFRKPRWIHEAELKPGLANAVLSLYATRVSLGFEEAKMPFWAKTIFTGHPLRAELAQLADETKQVDVPRHLLVLGGSQGARALDLAMQELALFCKQHDLEIWHQCRDENRADLESAFAEAGVRARVQTFIHELDEAYRWSDLIVSRAGAGVVSEIGIVGRPTVFVPYPFAQGDHQAANASVLVDSGKAIMVRESDQFVEQLRAAISTLLEPAGYREMAGRTRVERPVNAADVIAEGLIAFHKSR